MKYSSAIAKKELLIRAITWNNVRYVERKSQIKDYILYDSIHIKFKNSRKPISGHRNQKVVATEGGVDWKKAQGTR